MRWNRKERKETIKIKKEGQPGSGVGALNRRGGWNPHDELWHIFEHIFLSTTRYVIKLGQLIDISMDCSFQESFAQLGGLGFFQFSNLLQLHNNQLCQDFSVLFL